MSEHHSELGEQKAAARRRQSNDGGPGPTDANPGHPLLRLQSQVGNAHVARLLAQRAAEEEDVQAKHEVVGTEGGPVGPDTASRIQGLRGGGSALDHGMRTSMETAFGTSFSDVRVHTGGEADTLNRRLTARAFTTGSDIFLRRDASPNDARLLAHELTHVVQQRTLGGAGGGMRVGAAGDGQERHADAVAEAVTAAPSQAPAGPTAQRAEAEDEEVQASHDLAQRAGEEEEEVQASHDLAQRAGEEEEEVQASHDLAQREGAEEEEPA
jgi:Domain of unknown function (DUF4157)